MDPECVVTEEEDGYNAESDLEEDTEKQQMLRRMIALAKAFTD